MTAALAGLGVVDFTTTIAGPHCTRLLADLGATVIKIEAPDGDMMRTRPPLRDGASAMFGQLNVNKQSVVLDLKNPAGVAAARKLIDGADVLVENYRPGVMQRLGLDYASLSAANPRLVYCAISGYGQTGPSANLAAYAPVVQAASGYELTHIFYQDGRTKPDNMGIWVADVISGTYAFGAISAALHQRNATGRGQFIDVSMLECMLTLPLLELQSSQFPFTMASRRFAEPLKTADGYIIVAIASELTFQGAAAATGNPGWVTDPRFAKYPDRRLNWGEFIGELEAWMATRTTADCVATLSKHGVPCSAYRTVAEALKDPQLEHRQALVEVTDEAGKYIALNQPFRMSDLPPRSTATSPALGEHTEEVLGALGYSEAEIAALSGRATAAKAAAE
jgi:crotonobetainyl-CoA:carnitine CoA-transferase CaiB-like acyl-CoA transferase